jgi:hypothetical protein
MMRESKQLAVAHAYVILSHSMTVDTTNHLGNSMIGLIMITRDASSACNM